MLTITLSLTLSLGTQVLGVGGGYLAAQGDKHCC